MVGFVDNYNFSELEVQKYWAPPSSWSREKIKAETSNRVFSGTWIGSQKRDGALYVFLKDEDGNITLRGRSKSVSGEYIDKWDHLPHLFSWAESVPNGSCFLGEIYWKGNEGSRNTTTIMNCLTQKAINRQEKDENKMRYYIFDVLAYNNQSLLKEKAKNRFNLLLKVEEETTCKYIEFAHYYHGQKLWETLQQLLADGYEGMVIVEQDSIYEPGKRPSKTTMKVKKEINQTIDCFFTGHFTPPTRKYEGKEIETWPYWVNLITNEHIEGEKYMDYYNGAPIEPVTKPFFHNWAGSLEIGLVKGDKVVPIGYLSNLTEEIKSDPAAYKGRCIEVTCMEIQETGGLRHAKMLGFRDDLTVRECNWEKVFGG